MTTEFYFEVFINELNNDVKLSSELLKYMVHKDEKSMENMLNILYHHNLFFHTIKQLVTEEISDTHEVFLRGQSTGTIVLRYFQEYNGKAAYQAGLTKLFQKLIKKNLYLETIKSPPNDEKLQICKLKLSKLFAKVLKVISSISIPLGVAVVCSQVASVLRDVKTDLLNSFEEDGAEQLSVGSILFLYTICPLFISPDKSLEEEGFRNLIFFAKVLQTLANGCSFEQENMIAFNYLLDENRKNYQNFANKVVTIGSQYLSHFHIPIQTPFKEWKNFFNIINTNIKEIDEFIKDPIIKRSIHKSIEDTKTKKSSNNKPTNEKTTNEKSPNKNESKNHLTTVATPVHPLPLKKQISDNIHIAKKKEKKKKNGEVKRSISDSIELNTNMIRSRSNSDSVSATDFIRANHVVDKKKEKKKLKNSGGSSGLYRY